MTKAHRTGVSSLYACRLDIVPLFLLSHPLWMCALPKQWGNDLRAMKLYVLALCTTQEQHTPGVYAERKKEEGKMEQGNWSGGGPVNKRREDATIAGNPQHSQVRQVTFDMQPFAPQSGGCMHKGVVAPVAPPMLGRPCMALLGFLQPGIKRIKLVLIQQHRHAVPPIVLSFPRSLSSREGAC